MHSRYNFSFLFIGLALAVLSAMLRLWAFSQTPFANGWDSYFYLVQLQSLEETGQMHSPDASLIYPYLRLFYWLTGDYVLGMKTGVAVLCGLWVAVVYGSTAFRPSGQAPFKALVINKKGINAFFPDSLKAVLPVCIALFSPQLTYFAAQYPKNLLGLIFFGLFVNSLQRPAMGRSEISQLRTSHFALRTDFAWLLPAFWLALNYFGHRMTFGLAVVYLVLHLLLQAKQFTAARVKKALLFGAVAAGLFLIAGQFFPGLANMADSGRLQGVICAMPQFAPWSFVQTFGFQRISVCWLFEIVAVTALFLWNVFLVFRQKNHAALPLLLLCAALIFPFLEWSTTGLAWRFWMVFILLVPVACLSRIRVPGGEIGVACCYLLLLMGSFFSWKSYQPALHDPNYAQFQKITERTQTYFEGQPAPELVIAHNALAEYFTYSTGTDAMPWLPEYAIDSTRLWRIAAGIHEPTLQYFSGKENVGRIKNLGGNYYLLPEYVWQQVLHRARAEQDLDFILVAESWRNPWNMRPGWLLRKRG